MDSFWNEIRKRDFPITRRYVYLDHASGGPMPRPVWEKVKRYYEETSLKSDFAWGSCMREREKARESVARFIGAEPEEIAFTASTSHGMNLIAEILQKEGEVLTNVCEFPASTLPWLWRKVKLHWQEPEHGILSLEVLKSMLNQKKKTKIILTSFVQYATGFRQNLEAIGKIKGSRYFVVNATQGFGAFPIDVKKWKVDFLATNTYKWLMAGYGGVIYISRKWLRKFRPHSVGWRSMRQPDLMNNRRLDLRPDAARYEMGSANFASIVAAGSGVDYLSSIGIEKIAKRILELADFLRQGLLRKKYEVVSPAASTPGVESGIVIFRTQNPKATATQLLSRGIYVSPRGEGIRVAPHFYNNFEDIEKLLQNL